MIKKKLGKTNIYTTSIGFGGAPMGDLFEKLKEEDCYNTLRECKPLREIPTNRPPQITNFKPWKETKK